MSFPIEETVEAHKDFLVTHDMSFVFFLLLLLYIYI